MDFDLFHQPEPKRIMHENSVVVYREKVLPTLSGRRLEVFNAIKILGGEADMFMVAEFMGRPVHTISGRFSELRKLLKIEDTKINNKHGDSEFTIWKII